MKTASVGASRSRSKISEAQDHAMAIVIQHAWLKHHARVDVAALVNPQFQTHHITISCQSSPPTQSGVLPSQQNHPIFNMKGGEKDDFLVKEAMKAMQKYNLRKTAPTVARSPKIKSAQGRAERRKMAQSLKLKEVRKREKKEEAIKHKARTKAKNAAAKLLKRAKLRDRERSLEGTAASPLPPKKSSGELQAFRSAVPPSPPENPLASLAMRIANERRKEQAAKHAHKTCFDLNNKNRQVEVQRSANMAPSTNEEDVQNKVDAVMQRAEEMLKGKLQLLFQSQSNQLQINFNEHRANDCGQDVEDIGIGILDSYSEREGVSAKQENVQEKVNGVVQKAEGKIRGL
jgi:hypothetical protein